MKKISDIELIEHFILKDDLKTHDPYDIWKEYIGFRIKNIYYKSKIAGSIPAGLLYLGDTFCNNILKKFYTPQEYPIVRALASLTLINCFEASGNLQYLEFAEIHLKWLVQHYSRGYSGYCWGINFIWASKNGTYGKNTPYSTITPYVLEALIKYKMVTNTKVFDNVIKSIFLFFEKDIIIKHDSTKLLSLSYAPVDEPRIVINANSYALYSYSMLLNFFPEKNDYILSKIDRIYNFIVENQNQDGSWLYFADDLPGNFIDCFHTCFILQNLIKSSGLNPDIKVDPSVIEKGVSYLKENFFDKEYGLFKRFSLRDTPSLIKFDLYDNAEMLQLFLLSGDYKNYISLGCNIRKCFVCEKDVFSKVNLLNSKMYKNNLRWAAMPYLYALSLNL